MYFYVIIYFYLKLEINTKNYLIKSNKSNYY